LSDAFEGDCRICGRSGVFVRASPSLREGYKCSHCRAELRYQGQADVLIRRYASSGARSIADLIRDPAFQPLRIWEPGRLGPLRHYLRRLPNYVGSDYWPDAQPGDERDGLRCENVMALTFANASFDLVVTSDIFEHVRRPDEGFAEVHRVLRPGGVHVFSIPLQIPMRERTLVRVDTSGDEDIHLEQPRYHGGGNTKHLVYNDFGADLVARLAEFGFETDIVPFSSVNSEAARLLTLCSIKTR
jgi:SAM-dependent methyltransferase